MPYESPELIDGRYAEVFPTMLGPYKMQCCDCGLVHNIEFSVVEVTSGTVDRMFEYVDVENPKLRVKMRVSRNNRATGQIRRRRAKGVNNGVGGDHG